MEEMTTAWERQRRGRVQSFRSKGWREEDGVEEEGRWGGGHPGRVGMEIGHVIPRYDIR